MVRHPSYAFLKKGTWSPDEDQKLIAYIKRYGIWNWNEMPKYAGLRRTGKSCRLRWMNYLRPDIKSGNFTKEEEETIIKLHSMLGNRWSAIAARMPQRTDNEIKNYWNTRLKKRMAEVENKGNEGYKEEKTTGDSSSISTNQAAKAENDEKNMIMDETTQTSAADSASETYSNNEELHQLQGDDFSCEHPFLQADEDYDFDSLAFFIEGFLSSSFPSQLWLYECLVGNGSSSCSDCVDDFWVSSSF